MGRGIRIYGEENGQEIKLLDVLKEIHNGKSFHWALLHLEAKGFNEKIKEQPLTWQELHSLVYKLKQIYRILLIGSTDQSVLHRYTSEKEMYEACDIVVDLIEGAFGDIFSKDSELIDRLTAKFEEVEFLD